MRVERLKLLLMGHSCGSRRRAVVMRLGVVGGWCE